MSDFSRHDNESRPFAAGSVFGLRAFRAWTDGNLLGCAHPLPWHDGENVATCDLVTCDNPDCCSQTQEHRPASATCTCGFYAFYDGSNDYHRPIHSSRVTGIIEGYGLVTVGSRGFRAEKARIRALVIPDSPKGPLTADTREAIHRHLGIIERYPSADLFDTVEQALAAFPLTKPEDVGIEPRLGFAGDSLRVGGSSMGPHPIPPGWFVAGQPVTVSIHASASALQAAMAAASLSVAEVGKRLKAALAVGGPIYVSPATGQWTADCNPEPTNPVERKKARAERAAEARANAGLRGVGGFDRKGKRR